MAAHLTGKTAVVTGAGTDVGRAVATRLAGDGANVMLCHATDAELAAVRDDISGGNGKVATFCCNLEERLAVSNLLAATQDNFGRVDILVNTPRKSAPASFLDLEGGEFGALFEENVRSVFTLAQAVARRMIAQAEDDPEFSGRIVNITSIASRRTVPELFAYSVVCAALDQLTRSMAASLAEHRIRVNAVALGSVMTETLRSALKEREELRSEMVRVTPLGRIGETEEAASAVAYLASDQASFITGQILAVDGGRTVLDPLASPFR